MRINVIQGSVSIVRCQQTDVMAGIYLVTLVASIFALQVNALQTINGRIKITIQTTAGCTDTVRFIQDQLEPTYELYKEFLDIEFVPWGRATRDDNGTVICQFGVNDCWANRNHRCALEKLKENQDAQIHYMVCEYTSPFPSYNQASYLCSHAVGLSIVDMDYCVTSPEDELDIAAEIKGNELTELTRFIPSIVINDEGDAESQLELRQRFQSMICFALAADNTTWVTDCAV